MIEFTPEDIRNHQGTVEIFRPKIKHQDSDYVVVRDRELFLSRLAEPGAFVPFGRVEGRRMLVCMLPRGLKQ